MARSQREVPWQIARFQGPTDAKKNLHIRWRPLRARYIDEIRSRCAAVVVQQKPSVAQWKLGSQKSLNAVYILVDQPRSRVLNFQLLNPAGG